MTGHELKAKFLAVAGCYPLIHIDEYWDGDDVSYRPDMANILIDTEKLNLLEEFELGYVEHFFEEAVRAIAAGQTLFDTYGSRKYSFGDTPDWWQKIQVERKNHPMRTIITMQVAIR